MLRFVAAIAAAFALMISTSSVTRADTHAFCSDPAEDRPFTCGTVSVVLADGADLDAVLARSAPNAEAGPQDASNGSWLVYVDEGDEVATRDALRGDAEVEDASLLPAPEGYEVGDEGVRDVSGGGDPLPDTAMIAAPSLMAPIVAMLLLLATLGVWRTSR